MPEPRHTPPTPPTSWKLESVLVAALLLAIGCAYYFAIPPNFRPLRERLPSGYYGLQTEAFLAGQLHLRITTDPKLLTLKNPYAGPQGAVRPHDMSYYQGRFYLYYGATPVLLLYLPWRVVTGGYLGESLGMVMMLYGGVILAAGWLVALRRRWFPHLSPGWVLLLIATIGFGPPLFPSATNNTFYGVPIAGGFLCIMVAITAASRALSRPGLGAQAGWLAFASLFWGLAVGSRPIYVLGLVALAVPALYLWWRTGAERWRWLGLRLLAAAVIPAAVVGVAIMFYNYMRFDSPVDFGIRFSMASGDLREAKLVGPEFIGKNLHLYLLTTASFIRYYPFLIVDTNTWGLLPHLPFAVLSAFFPLTWVHRPLRDSRWVLPGVLLAGAAAGNFALLCLFFGGEERYMLDFAPLLLLLAATTALPLLDLAVRLTSRLGAGLIRLLVGGLIALTLVTGLMLTLPRHDALINHRPLERLLNIPTHLFETWSGTTHGPVELDVIFPRDRLGTTEPLLATGLGARSGDGIMVRYVDETHVQFSAFHVGRGGPVSEPVEVDYAVPHRLSISLGSLYPPLGHPLFWDWPATQAARIRRRLKVTLDDRTVLQGNFIVHAATPAGLLIGRSHLPNDVAAQGFTGRILAQHRPGPDRAEAAGFENAAGPVRLTVRFPPLVGAGDEGLPLVATGEGATGDILFARLLPDNMVRFGHDSFGGGAIVSTAVPYDPAVDQVIDVEMGSLYPPNAPEVPAFNRRRLRVALNGNTVIDTSRPFNTANPETVEFGFNTIGASTAIGYFPGAIRKIERIPASQPDESLRKWGPLRLGIELPAILTPVAEPLVITGRTGRADVLFVRYEADGRVRFGIDHWGIGVAVSEPVRLDPSRTLMLEFLSGGLLPPAEDPAWAGRDPATAAQLRGRLEVRVNGRTVLAPAFAPYSNETAEISYGRNLIGASTCESGFTGRFLLVERLPW